MLPVTVVGDGSGRIGIGVVKAREVPVAIQKSLDNARKNMQQVILIGDTLHHKVEGKHGATHVFMKPAQKVLVLSLVVRCALSVKYLGIKNVLAKIGGSTNQSTLFVQH